ASDRYWPLRSAARRREIAATQTGHHAEGNAPEGRPGPEAGSESLASIAHALPGGHPGAKEGTARHGVEGRARAPDSPSGRPAYAGGTLGGRAQGRGDAATDRR